MWTSLPHFKRESSHQSAPVSPVDAAARISSEEKEVLSRDLLTSPVRGTDLLIWSKSLSSRFRHRRLEDRADGRLGTTPLSSGISSGKVNIFYQNKQIHSPVLLILPSLARPLCGTPGLEDLRGIFFQSEKLPLIFNIYNRFRNNCAISQIQIYIKMIMYLLGSFIKVPGRLARDPMVW